MSEAEDWTVIVRAKNQEIQKWQQQALELSNLVMPLREEVARLRGALTAVVNGVAVYGHGHAKRKEYLADEVWWTRKQQDHAFPIWLAWCALGKPEQQAALTPQAGKGGANG